MKKLVLLAAAVAGVLTLRRKKQSADADAALWREATAGNRS